MAFVKTHTIDQPADEITFINASDEAGGYVICKSPEKLQRLLSSLECGKQIHYVSEGSWSIHNLVLQLVKKYQQAELFITTYALREFPVMQLINAIEDNSISSVTMLLDSRARIRTPEVYQLASMNLNKIFLTNIHAKVAVIKSPRGYLSIVGSSNWTTNPKIEAGVISLSSDVAEFHINWITKISENAEIFK